MSKVTSIKASADSLRQQLDALVNHRRERSEQLAAKQERQRYLLKSPLARPDVEHRLLAAIAAQQRQSLVGELPAELAHLQKSGISEALDDRHPVELSPFCAALDGKFSDKLADLILLTLGEPAAILARLLPALNAMDWTKSGPSLASRREELATLHVEISRLESELSEIVTALQLSAVDPDKPTGPTGPQIGERRQFDGHWATWNVLIAGSPPGWIFDRKSRYTT